MNIYKLPYSRRKRGRGGKRVDFRRFRLLPCSEIPSLGPMRVMDLQHRDAGRVEPRTTHLEEWVWNPGMRGIFRN